MKTSEPQLININTATGNDLEKRIISVHELLTDRSLTIPQYQRPYKWTEKNINQLFGDIAVHKEGQKRVTAVQNRGFLDKMP